MPRVPIMTPEYQPLARKLCPSQADPFLVLAALNWKVDGAVDYSAAGNNGTPAGGVIFGHRGAVLDGADDVIDFGDLGDIQEISLWIKPETTTEQIVLVDAGNYIHLVAGTVTYVGLTASATYVNNVASTTLAAGEWQHLVCQFTQVDANNFELGVDGAGNFGEIAVMDLRARDGLSSASEISYDYSQGVPDDSLVLHVPGRGGARDYSRFQGDMAPINGAVVGHRIELTAASLHYVYRSVANWRSGDSLGAAMAWIRLGAVDADQVVFSSSDEASNVRALLLRINAANRIEVVRILTGFANDAVNGTTTTFTAGRWYHIAYVSTGTAYALYVNGQAEALNVSSGTNSGDWFADVPLRDNAVIGAWHRLTGPALNYLDGDLDDVKVHSVVKSTDNIAAYYAATRRYC